MTVRRNFRNNPSMRNTKRFFENLRKKKQRGDSRRNFRRNSCRYSRWKFLRKTLNTFKTKHVDNVQRKALKESKLELLEKSRKKASLRNIARDNRGAVFILRKIYKESSGVTLVIGEKLGVLRIPTWSFHFKAWKKKSKEKAQT